MKKIVVIGIWVLLLIGCSAQSYEPREINQATDICKICNMSIVSNDYAAQVVLSNGDYEVFDDIGCLMEFIAGKDVSEIGAMFIKGIDGEKWISVETATYVYGSEFWSPMNYGVLTFATEDEAKQYIKEAGQGTLLTFEELKTFEWGVHE